MKRLLALLLAVAACTSPGGPPSPRPSDVIAGAFQPGYNPSVGPFDGSPPTQGTQVGFQNDAGTLVPAGVANPFPVAATVNATNPSVGTTAAAVPASATYCGGNQGGNLVGLPAGNASAPMRVDPTGSTNQPVTGTLTCNLGTIAGVATAANQTNGTQESLIFDGTNVIGTSAHPVRTDPTGTTNQPVTGTLTCNAGSGTFTIAGTVTSNIGTTGGLALDTTLTGGTAKCQPYDGTNTVGTAAHPMIVNAGTGGGTNATTYTEFGSALEATIASGVRALLSLVTTNRDTANDVYVNIDDTPGLPDGGAPSTYAFPCPKAPAGSISVCGYDQTMRPNGWPVGTGLSYCISTTSKTCTTAGLDGGNSDLMVGYQ